MVGYQEWASPLFLKNSISDIMKKINILSIISITLFVFYACSTDADVDKLKPEIDISITGAFPVNCDTLYFDEPFTFKAKFTDNEELGSYSVDIHNNFDHHSHSTEAEFESCGNMDQDKDATSPFTFIEEYSIPEGSSEYTTDLSLTIPSADGDGIEYQEGDYHMYISLTDKQGWSAQKGLSIKIIRR